MGSRNSKDIPITELMSDKYGPESIICLTHWTKCHGFFNGGSLSKEKLQTLRKSLPKVEEELKKIKKSEQRI